jgi:FPC/CPF motif-containing protein YcgG
MLTFGCISWASVDAAGHTPENRYTINRYTQLHWQTNKQKHTQKHTHTRALVLHTHILRSTKQPINLAILILNI